MKPLCILHQYGQTHTHTHTHANGHVYTELPAGQVSGNEIWIWRKLNSKIRKQINTTESLRVCVCVWDRETSVNKIISVLCNCLLPRDWEGGEGKRATDQIKFSETLKWTYLKRICFSFWGAFTSWNWQFSPGGWSMTWSKETSCWWKIVSHLLMSGH